MAEKKEEEQSSTPANTKVMVSTRYPTDRFIVGKVEVTRQPVEMSEGDAEKVKAQADKRNIRLNIERKK